MLVFYLFCHLRKRQYISSSILYNEGEKGKEGQKQAKDLESFLRKLEFESSKLHDEDTLNIIFEPAPPGSSSVPDEGNAIADSTPFLYFDAASWHVRLTH